MHTYNDILRNTLETMASDAEDKGKDRFTITLDFNDVKILVDGLKRLEPVSAAVCDDIVPFNSPLADTVEGMLHPDYKERFKAEYKQTKIRYEKLKAFNTKIEAAQLTGNVEEPKHDCPAPLLREQQRIMGEYLHLLEVRAEIEHVDLNSI